MPSRPSATGRREYPSWGTASLPRRDCVISSRGKTGSGRSRFALHQHHAVLARHHLADVVTVDGLAGERVDHDPGIGRAQGHEQRAGGDRAERVEAEGLTALGALGQDDDALAIDAQPDAGRRGQLPQRGGDAALGRVVHRVHLGQLAGDLRLGQHAEPGAAQERLGLADGRPGGTPRASSSVSRSRAMMAAPSSGTPLVITTASPTRAPAVVTRRSFGHLAEHRAGHDRTVETGGDLGVAADQRHLELGAGRAELVEERRSPSRPRRAALGQQQGGEEPARRAPRARRCHWH